MPKQVQLHASERIDKVDADAILSYAKDSANLSTTELLQDRLARIVRGFRVEIPSQTDFPGRIVVHGGIGLDFDGDIAFNEDQLDVSRTITLEGSNTNFFVEIEFNLADSDLDARAFWDPTVDQGTDVSGDELPDGQEYNNTIATRKTPDWKVSQPISTSTFDVTSTPSSLKIPLVLLRTDGTNKINTTGNVNMTTEKAATTLLRDISGAATEIVVQNPQLIPTAGGGNLLTLSEGEGVEEDVTVVSTNRETGVVEIGATGNAHTAGAIIRAKGSNTSDFVTEGGIGPYRRRQIANFDTPPNHQVDWRDKLYQGDEIHGDILSRGHASITDKSDVNLQSLKDYVDFLSAQIQEMKWGIADPHVVMTDSSRLPPASFPSVPRHYDRPGGLAGARAKTITVGNGTTSFGDFNGATHVVINAAIAAATAGDTVFIKKGSYSMTSNVLIDKSIVLEGDELTVLNCDGGAVEIDAPTETVGLKNLTIARTSSIQGLLITDAPDRFQMADCLLSNVYMDIADEMPGRASDEGSWIERCRFISTNAAMASDALVQVGAAGWVCGMWTECEFYHQTANTVTGAVIDASAGMVNTLTFGNCRFKTNSGSANPSAIHLGATVNSENINFDHCRFHNTGSITGAVVVMGDGTSIGFVHCSSFSTAPFVTLTGVNDIVIDGLRQEYAVTDNALEFIDCNNVVVCNCVLGVNSGGSITHASVYVEAVSGTFDNYLIQGNTLIDAGGDGTGAIFSHNGGILTDIKVQGNRFETCEVGMYFANPGAAQTFRNVVIADNQFLDIGVSASVASAQKVGVLTNTTSFYTEWTISGNNFVNLNPATAATVGGATRNGIYFAKDVGRITITGNTFNGIGSAGSPQSNVSAIRFANATSAVITGNEIDKIDGTDCYGIQLSDVGKLANGVTVSGNHINDVTGVNSSAAIFATSISDSAIGGNTIRAVTGGTGPGIFTAGISVDGDAAGTYCRRVAISGNSIQLADADGFGIRIAGETTEEVSIQGNTISGTPGDGIYVYGVTGGSVYRVSVTGNTVAAQDLGIAINISSISSLGSIELVSVVGNSILTTANNAVGISINYAQFVTVSNNTIDNTAASSGLNRGISCYSSLNCSVCGNSIVCSADGDGINIGVSSDNFIIFGNIIHGCTGTGDSINTLLAGSVSGEVITALNLAQDGTGNISGNDLGIDTMALLGVHITQYT